MVSSRTKLPTSPEGRGRPQGTCPPMLRSNVVARGPHLPLWQGVTPHAVLRDWFDDEELSPGIVTVNNVVDCN